LIIPNCGLAKKKKQGVKLPDGKTNTEEAEVHILYNITFSILLYLVYLFVMIDIFGCMFSPYHCNMSEPEAIVDNDTLPVEPFLVCSFSKVNPISICLKEFGYVISIIFMLGPIRLFFKIKEGKTSLEKIKEDF